MQKIVFTGPESTGKSTLSAFLAQAMDIPWVPEYARVYLEELDRSYVEDDILHIAQGQVRWEKERSQEASALLSCDTALLVPKIWSEFKYKRVHPWITKELYSRKEDFYFLCDVDLPWEYDPLREHPHQRSELFELYQKELEQMGVRYVVLSGSLEERKQAMLLHIQEKFPHLCESKF